jgi:hypothetical protein
VRKKDEGEREREKKGRKKEEGVREIESTYVKRVQTMYC